MKKIFYTCLIFVYLAVIAYAASVTFNITTAGQDTYIRANILPLANKDLCLAYGLPANCTSGDLATKGCVAVPFSDVTKRSLTYRNCTPFTLDSTGQANHAADVYAKALISRFEQEKAVEVVAACTNFKALSAANQNTICALLGPPVPATVCNICM